MARNRQLVRELQLLRMLESGRWHLSPLAVELGVSTRTIRRDLEALEEAGIPLVLDEDCRWHVYNWRKEAA